eukprot:TRINITY_DN37698_c0_g1_i1.p1 TRINITY_DN37698_c0_g1~~TRINITY_DN37698_c0_g1_i1.p1  ORF type:complete len:744 (+),score=144.35 TRINITY_DN37698_c0_g1_i1:62-2233(+)
MAGGLAVLPPPGQVPVAPGAQKPGRPAGAAVGGWLSGFGLEAAYNHAKPRSAPAPGRAAEETQDDEEEEEEDCEDSEAESTDGEDDRASGIPPALRDRQASVPQRSGKRRRGARVSICIAKCRSSLSVVRLATERLRWREISRETTDVSVAWLEHTDSRHGVSPFQVVSKIEGMVGACRKAELAASLRTMQESYPDDYAFFPRTWILSSALPEEAADLERTMGEKKGWTYICKPTAGSQGKGVKIVKSFGDLRGPLKEALGRSMDMHPRPRLSEFVVQRYVSKPLLVDGYKFDCRCYIVVTSIVPLRAYLFEEGLARFCTTKYTPPKRRNLGNACMHLTNFAVNKHSDNFQSARSHDEGTKRSLSSVFERLEAEGGPTASELWGYIRSIAEKTLLALRPSLVEHLAEGVHGALHPAGPKAFHILGFDVMFDDRFRPFLLELNANSSMNITQPVTEPDKEGELGDYEISELDLAVKEELICQALLVVDPLPHWAAMRGRAAWLSSAGEVPRNRSAPVAHVDEPIPFGDDGDPVYEGAVPRPPRPDRPQRCPALVPLDFESQPAAAYAYCHLLAYRVWRHYAFTPAGSCPLKESVPVRRYIGFGRPQFRRLCDGAGLVAGTGHSSELVCWPDRAAADLFFQRAVRDAAPERGVPSAGVGSTEGSNTAAVGAALDFPCFLRRLALPIGDALASALGVTSSFSERPSRADALETFLERAWPTIQQQS